MNLRKALSEYRWRERTIHPGKAYPDHHFYVIRRHANRAGLFSFAATNLGSVVEAVEKGYTPVIDMKNSPNPMLAAEEIGRINAWDRLFLPPCGFTLEDIEEARTVTLGSIHPPQDGRYPEYRMLENPEELAFWRTAAGQYLKVRPEIEQAAEAYCRKMEIRQSPDDGLIHAAVQNSEEKERYSFPEGGKVLGVLCRGTDYTLQKPKDHPVQPSVQDVIEKCREVMAAQGCRRIYLCTEDQRIWEEMKEAFPARGQVISYQRQRIQLDAVTNVNDAMNAVRSPFERNREYLISIRILSKCDCLVAGAAGGTYGALLMTKGYEYEYVFRLGRYK